jgi:hypothetical protein
VAARKQSVRGRLAASTFCSAAENDSPSTDSPAT